MAGAAPYFFNSPLDPVSAIVPATADTSLTAPTNVTGDLAVGTAAGVWVTHIDINQVATTSAGGYINFFTYNGSTYSLIYTFAFSAQTINSTTELATQTIQIPDLFLMSSSKKLRATVTAAAGQSAFNLTAYQLGAA